MKKNNNKTIQFFVDVWYEIRHKTTWPSMTELWQTTLIVVLFVAVWSLFLGVTDTVYAKALETFLKFATGVGA